MPSPVAITDEVVTLWKQEIGVCDVISPSMEHDMTVEHWRDRFHHLLLGIRTYVLTEKLEDVQQDFHFSWPRSRWQAFKEKHLPNFIRWRLVPSVKYEHRTAHADMCSTATFPQASLITPELGKPVYMRKATWNVYPTS